MAALTCPRCNAAVRARDKLPARCESCGAALHCCRNCASFDHRVLDCAHPDLVDTEHITDADEVRSCRYFDFCPRITTAPPRTFLWMSFNAWVSVLVLIVLGVLLYVGITRTSTSPPQSALQLHLQAPGTIIQEDPCELSFSIINSSQESARELSLTIDSHTLAGLEYTQAEPAPRSMIDTGRSLRLNYSDLPAGQTLSGSLSFKPKRSGTLPINLMLSAANAEKAETADTKVQVTE